ncbi:peptide chain release factor 2 [candidate division KSB1 bacterium]|nr:MAG: peptide chain release factor 2 [candidate division KSB1 bacterium]
MFEVDRLESEIAELEAETGKSDFWNDSARAQTTLQQISQKKDRVERWKKLKRQQEDIEALFELSNETDDDELLPELQQELDAFRKSVENLELESMLAGVDDSKNAILTIHAGAGGTEAQDWAEMLLRMYLRWLEQKGYEHYILDIQPGEEAGIKSAVLEVRGDYAYGYLKAEAGVHRLVRLSPFDANHRRHTSFASVFVYPEVESDVEVDINPKDLRIDTFRASGAGGQHVNKTSSAVRITHIPTGIVVQCQAERSQHSNRENAMKILRARLYQKKREEEQQKRAEIEKTKKEIAWGSQIRSYVFHPYSLVKDHRTGVETGNVQAVMDGDLDEFIKGFLTAKDLQNN